MAGFDAAAGDPVGVGDRVEALLAARPQVQVVLQQPAHQLPPAGVEFGLQLGVLHRGGLGAVEETHHRLERLPAGGEPGAGLGRAHPRARRPRRAPSRSISAARPASPAATSSASAAR